MASDAYMELETRDLIGESFDQGFGMDKGRQQGAFEIASFSFSASVEHNPTPQAPVGGGNKSTVVVVTGSDKQKKNEYGNVPSFTITKPIDSSSPDLFVLCCKQDEIKWAVITLREAGEAGDPKN